MLSALLEGQRERERSASGGVLGFLCAFQAVQEFPVCPNAIVEFLQQV